MRVQKVASAKLIWILLILVTVASHAEVLLGGDVEHDVLAEPALCTVESLNSGLYDCAHIANNQKRAACYEEFCAVSRACQKFGYWNLEPSTPASRNVSDLFDEMCRPQAADPVPSLE